MNRTTREPSSLGLGALSGAYPVLLRVLGLLGGTYLAWLGFKGWRSALTGTAREIAPRAGRGVGRDVLHGLVVTATNPKVSLLWASLTTFVGGATTSWPSLLLFAGLSTLLGFAIYGAYGLVFFASGIRRLYDRSQRTTEATFGTIFGTLGVAMFVRAGSGE